MHRFPVKERSWRAMCINRRWPRAHQHALPALGLALGRGCCQHILLYTSSERS